MMDKLRFLEIEFPELLASIPLDTAPLFGKMNVLQMIEHMAYAFQQASGLVVHPTLHDAETTQKMYRFMMSDKPFRDNTPNPYLPDEPLPASYSAQPQAIEALKQAIQVFKETFTDQPEKRLLNPFFGELNFEEWTHLLFKHSWHHLRQFGINQNND